MNPKAAVAIVFDEAENLVINSDMPIKSISTYGWWGSLTAPSVGSITTKSNAKLDKWGGLDIDAKVAGTIGSVKVASWLEGEWDCNVVKSIATLNTDDFYLTLHQKPNAKVPALGKMTVKEWFDWSQILSAGNIGTFTAGGMWHSTCFAGVTATSDVEGQGSTPDDVLDLPSANAANFGEQATIKSISIKGIQGRYSALLCQQQHRRRECSKRVYCFSRDLQ